MVWEALTGQACLMGRTPHGSRNPPPAKIKKITRGKNKNTKETQWNFTKKIETHTCAQTVWTPLQKGYNASNAFDIYNRESILNFSK